VVLGVAAALAVAVSALAGGIRDGDVPEAQETACQITPIGASVCEGAAVTLTCEAAGGVPGYTYRWHKEPYDGACLSTESELTLVETRRASSGQYRVIVTDAAGEPDTSYATLTVCEAPAPPDQALLDGAPDCTIYTCIEAACRGVRFELCGPNIEGYTYMWHGPEADGATTRCIFIYTPGVYSLTVTDAEGDQATCSFEPPIIEYPICSITGGVDRLCGGATTTWCAPEAPAGVTYTYWWEGPGIYGVTTRCITISTPGTYTVWVTADYLCRSSCSRTLYSGGDIDCTIEGEDVICAGTTTTWCAPVGQDYTYLWSGPEQDGATTRCITIGAPGIYSVTVTDPAGCQSTCYKALANYTLPDCAITGAGGCCEGNPVTWCAPYVPGWTYLWHGPEQDGATTYCITVSTPGDYSVTVTDENGCQATCTRALSASPGPECSISGETSVCTGGTVEWCGPDVAGYTYLWHGPEQDGATTRCITIGTAGTYTLMVTDDAGCESTCEKCLTTYDQPACKITGKCVDTNTLCDDCPPCPGTLLTWCGPDVAGYTYLWNGPEDDGATTRCITIGTPGVYTLTVTDPSGCVSRCSARLHYADAPVCNIVAPDPLPDCESTGNRLSATVTGDVSSYSWSVSGSGWAITSGKYTSTVTYTAGDNGSTGRFTLVVKNRSGCKDTCRVEFGCNEVERTCTFTQGGWGSGCPCSQKYNMMSTQPGCVRDHYFTQVFTTADGVKLGGSPYWAKWTTARAVERYLPANGTVGVLTGNRTNPTSTSMGKLGSQLLALRLNREFTCAGVFYYLGLASTPACYGDYVIPNTTACGSRFAGMTVDQFLALADVVVAGNPGALTPYGASLTDLHKTAACLNEMFDDCDPYGGCLTEDGTPDDGLLDETDPGMLGAPSPTGQASLGLPEAFDVSQIYPNPINPGTTITYALPREGSIVIEIYDVQGSRVATLVDEVRPAGYHSVYWDGTNDQGRNAHSGVYFCRGRFGDDENVSRKMIKLQ
jgi:hypothetical protein